MKPKLKLSELNHSLSVAHKMLDGKCEWFPFFGTLLGIVRDGSLIDGDDDVDIYVHHKNYDLVKSILHDNGFEIDYNQNPNHTPYFFQIIGAHDGVNIRIDFHFYIDSDDDLFIEDWWRHTTSNGIEDILRIPKPFIFPLKGIEYKNILITIPNHSDILCDFLYGKNWRLPQQKGVEYVIFTFEGRRINRNLVFDSFLNLDNQLRNRIKQAKHIKMKLQDRQKPWWYKLILRVQKRGLAKRTYKRLAYLTGIRKYFS